mgnify:CR=1 FL=1
MKKDLTSATIVKVDNLFPNFVATKNLDLSKLKIVGKNFKETFESEVKTTLKTETLFDLPSMNYLNLELTNLLSNLLKPICKTFTFNLSNIWINRYDNNSYQASHVHPSHFSFIIYWDVDKSHTVFNSPVKNLLETFENTLFPTDYEPNLKKGDIIMFPSYLTHWVRPNSNNVTISGNINIIDIKK